MVIKHTSKIVILIILLLKKKVEVVVLGESHDYMLYRSVRNKCSQKKLYVNKKLYFYNIMSMLVKVCNDADSCLLNTNVINRKQHNNKI